MTRLATGFLMALLFGLGSCAASQSPTVGYYRGQVVDADTGEPLPGVIVVFLWYGDVYSPVTKRITTKEFHKVTEVLTDIFGHFEVSAAPESESGPFIVEVRRTDPIFFLPGYLLDYKAQNAGDPLLGPTIIYLKRAKNPRDAVEPLPLVPSFPFGQTPLFLKALNQERARLGLPPIQPSKEGKTND